MYFGSKVMNMLDGQYWILEAIAVTFVVIPLMSLSIGKRGTADTSEFSMFLLD